MCIPPAQQAFLKSFQKPGENEKEEGKRVVRSKEEGGG